jgi:hypothetical protein
MGAVAAPRVGRGGGMNASHNRRLARLEQAKLEQERRPAANVLYVWRNAPTGTTEAAIARTFPHGLPADARLVICSWQVAGSLENPISEA